MLQPPAAAILATLPSPDLLSIMSSACTRSGQLAGRRRCPSDIASCPVDRLQLSHTSATGAVQEGVAVEDVPVSRGCSNRVIRGIGLPERRRFAPRMITLISEVPIMRPGTLEHCPD